MKIEKKPMKNEKETYEKWKENYENVGCRVSWRAEQDAQEDSELEALAMAFYLAIVEYILQ